VRLDLGLDPLAEGVIAMLRDDEASRSVWLDQETGAIQSGTIAIESSTLSLTGIKALHSAFAKADRRFLDAPVVGSRPQAEGKQLVFLVGGELHP
jgi:3-hydroxyisobutyrate dehydrogenase-like beta-hydroxyacid dehydrogenase